uniref:Glucosamine-6-phosphate isomerase n=1 Tax=Culex tarsalis TaxID=7177 RepID=A0A1Q3FD50_CULTA
MRLIILDTSDYVGEWSAKYVMKRINDFKPGPDKYFTLGLPTGSTPLGLYKNLIKFHKEGKISFQYVKTFNMDEYVDLARDHPESYHYFMWHNFFKHIDIDPQNVHILDGNAPDLVAECNAFEDKIKAAGGIELFIGGIGPDGHIAFNEPGSSLVSRTRVKTLAQDTLEANARFFGNDISKVPKQALTVGVGTVMDAREVMILITGAHKAFALYKAIEEGVNHMWTVSAFQQHPHTIMICDEDATLELRVKTVKYFKEQEKLLAQGVPRIRQFHAPEPAAETLTSSPAVREQRLEEVGSPDNSTEKDKAQLAPKPKRITRPTLLSKNQCTTCGKNFQRPSDLRYHVNTHTGAKPYKCVNCEAEFSHPSRLKKHTKRCQNFQTLNFR